MDIIMSRTPYNSIRILIKTSLLEDSNLHKELDSISIWKGMDYTTELHNQKYWSWEFSHNYDKDKWNLITKQILAQQE